MRNWLFKKIFSKQILYLEVEQMRAEHERASLATEREEFDAYRKGLSVADLVREKMASFNPRLFNSENDVLQDIIEDDGEESFLIKVKELTKNDALRRIADYLLRDLIMFAAKEGKDLEQINFSRASVNGVGLMMEEIERLAAVYDDRHKREEDYDAFEAT